MIGLHNKLHQKLVLILLAVLVINVIMFLTWIQDDANSDRERLPVEQLQIQTVPDVQDTSSFLHKLNNKVDIREIKDRTLRSPWSNSSRSTAMHGLLDEMGHSWHFSWIKERITKMWPEFDAAGQKLNKRCHNRTRRKRVMLLPGVLTLTNFARPEVIRSGGSLGELLQWADLIAGCYALCHDVAFRLHIDSVRIELLTELENENTVKVTNGCDPGNYADAIFTDIGGFRTLPDVITTAYKNRFRILDAFGTEAKYNDPEYATAHGYAINRWGMLGLNLKQFFTMYPHTPDNSFLGFTLSKSSLSNKTKKENYALIMGKDPRYLEGKLPMLSRIQKLIPLRATMPYRSSSKMPDGTIVDGVLDSETYRSITDDAKICIGLGNPVESPSILEALALGCVFLNPARKGKDRTFEGKPTGRLVDSQVPYLNDYVGAPHVYKIDDENLDQLENTIRTILSSPQEIKPFIPLEYSVFGFLQRLDAYLQHQDYCSTEGRDWPPMSSMTAIVAPLGMSCQLLCQTKGLVCEPDFFPLINNVSFISSLGLTCYDVYSAADPSCPMYFMDSRRCCIQSRPRLFSCAGSELLNATRICPCRDYLRHQVALCKHCT